MAADNERKKRAALKEAARLWLDMYTLGVPVDFVQVLTDLARNGVPVASVSTTIRVPKSTILGWKQSSEPKHVDGEALIAFWIKVTSKARSDLPRRAQ